MMTLFSLHTVLSASLIIAMLIVAALMIIPSIYLVLHKRNIPEHSVPLLLKILLLIPSLTWVGIFTGSYIAFRKKKINQTKQYKFSSNSRFYGIFLLLLSVVCTIIYYTSKNNPF
ncbi:hypothetical protein [Pseudofulvibacter geojedonensis]|uniref:Cardiolipin synthase N-terminal domain-containing protein n=1 Tax=Pseudofulvibacter geojedonensis TaxID=1123758 RepID=A0ABW3HZI6_9FLAO